MYKVELSEPEILSLSEALAELRKYIVREYGSQGIVKQSEAMQDPLFVAACQLQFKFTKIHSPNSSVRLQDYYNYGTDGLTN